MESSWSRRCVRWGGNHLFVVPGFSLACLSGAYDTPWGVLMWKAGRASKYMQMKDPLAPPVEHGSNARC